MSTKNFMSYADAETLFTAIGQKFDEVEGAYVFKGSSTFANLPATPTAAMTGYVYNMSEQFTTDSRFIEGLGKKYPAGTNVAIANTGTEQSPTMMFDVIGEFVDVDALNNRIDAAVADLADEFDSTEAYAVGDIITYSDGLYKFKAAHTANDPWDATEVDAVTVADLIASAEPDSLTTAQVNALLALLN